MAHEQGPVGAIGLRDPGKLGRVRRPSRRRVPTASLRNASEASPAPAEDLEFSAEGCALDAAGAGAPQDACPSEAGDAGEVSSRGSIWMLSGGGWDEGRPGGGEPP